MRLRDFFNPFHIIPGAQPSIAIGAPHHGTRPNVDADLATGPIAQALAARLEARAVIVNDLRRTVDVNKSPVTLAVNVRHHALRYQNELFRDLPRLVIEIHGHVSGQYPVELTSGFDLDSSYPGDSAFLERLCVLKETLPGRLSGKLGKSYAVGVYPIDQDVRKTATNTYTFQKIRRARNLAGLEFFGLHIELIAELRTGAQSRAPGYVDALADALAMAIEMAFGPFQQAGNFIPTHPDLLEEGCQEGIPYRVVKTVNDAGQEKKAFLNQLDLSANGLLDGDDILLYNGAEQICIPVSSSEGVRRGEIAFSARIRRQLDIMTGELITLCFESHSNLSAGEAPAQKPGLYFLVSEICSERKTGVWMNAAGLEQLQQNSVSAIRLQSATGESLPASVTIDNELPERVVTIDAATASRSLITIGDVVRIESI